MFTKTVLALKKSLRYTGKEFSLGNLSLSLKGRERPPYSDATGMIR